jgi:outer membrane protein OmpA-like peptidoglycan-associated protein
MKAFLLVLLVACAPRPLKVVTPPELAAAPVFDPPSQRRVITETSIEVYETIQFVGNTAQIAEASAPMLDAIARTLQRNPSITLLEIRGHSDWEEPDRVKRAELSIQRADHVVAALIARGVEPERLTAYGASDSEPLSVSDPVVNRRIELRILQRDSH